MLKILFVCYANICRSPTAEGIMRQLIADSGRTDIQVDSAGIQAYLGDAPDSKSVYCAASHGIDISDLRSRQVRVDDFADFDLIITMDEDCRQFLELRRPHEDERYSKALVKNLLDYTPGMGENVPNPYGTNGFEEVYVMIDEACRELFEQINLLIK